MQTIGEKIKELRKGKNVSQEELAFQLGVSRQTVHKWENNAMQPNADNIKSLCDFFKVSPNYFFGNTDGVNAEIAAAQSKPKYKLSILIIISVFVLLAFFISVAFTIGSGFVAFTQNEGIEVVSTLVIDEATFYTFLALSLILLAIEVVMIFHIKQQVSN